MSCLPLAPNSTGSACRVGPEGACAPSGWSCGLLLRGCPPAVHRTVSACPKVRHRKRLNTTALRRGEEGSCSGGARGAFDEYCLQKPVSMQDNLIAIASSALHHSVAVHQVANCEHNKGMPSRDIEAHTHFLWLPGGLPGVIPPHLAVFANAFAV